MFAICANGHKVTLPVCTGGDLKTIICWACVAGVK